MPPSPPDIIYNPSTVPPNTRTTLQVSGTFASAGDTLVFLPAGTSDCTGAVHAATASGGIVSASMTLDVTMGTSGTYKTCISRLIGPTLDSQFIYLPGARLVVDTPPLGFGPGTYFNPASNQCEIKCDAGGRRMEEDQSKDQVSAADDIVSHYLLTHPELAAVMNDELRKHILDLVRIGELFGRPAVA